MISVVQYLSERVEMLNSEIQIVQTKFDNMEYSPDCHFVEIDLLNLKSEKRKFTKAIELISKNGIY